MSAHSYAHQSAPQSRWSDLTQAERNDAYDNVKAVANSADLIVARNIAAEAYRAAHANHLDVPYGRGDRQKLDLYPAADSQAPCLVFIHGGYWQRNSREFFAAMAEGALARGLCVAMPGYSLAPEASLTEIVAEIGRALNWLAREGPAHGAGGPAILTGWSAGAHLAAMALDHPHVKAGVGISGVYELGPIRDTDLNVALKLSDQEIATLSPLRLPPSEKPFSIAYGSAELPALVEDSQQFHRLRAAAHAPGWLLPIAGANHFTVLDALREANGEILAAIMAMAGRVR